MRISDWSSDVCSSDLLAVAVKGTNRIMLVTDAMPSVGTDASEFTLQGKRIAVKDGVCIFEDGTLAGTHLDMATALRETVKVTGLDEIGRASCRERVFSTCRSRWSP